MMRPEELSNRQENNQNSVSENREKMSLYPERASANVADQVKLLHDIETGKVEKRELTEVEKAEVLEFEKGFGEKLEEIFLIKVNNNVFSVEYFLTERGKRDFLDVVGEEFKADDLESAKLFLYQKRDVLAGIDPKKRSDLAGNSKIFENIRVEFDLIGNLRDNKEPFFEGVEMPKRISLLYNPKEALEKIEELRKLKQEIKGTLEESKHSQNDDNEEYAKSGILKMYLRKINELIVSERDTAVRLLETEESLGKGLLTEEESSIINQFAGLSGGDRGISRMDKFIHGASTEYDKNGERPQINSEMIEFARSEGEKSLQNELTKEDNVREKGLDMNSLNKKNITKEEFVSYAEEALRVYDLLSSEDPEEYSEDRKEPAKDGKWQIIARSEYRSMKINGKQKVVKTGIKNKSIVDTIAVLIAHEIEVHVLQVENKEKIPLKIFDKVGADRSAIFSEGGAMMNQEEAKKELFGIEESIEPHYLAAMVKKFEGGNYLECVQAFYQSAIKSFDLQKSLGKIDQKSFDSFSKEKMALAVNRTERLFRGGANYNSKDSILAKSKDTVYLEQAMLMRKLKENGIEKYAFLGGLNLRNLTFLAEIGLVDLKDIQEPRGYAKEIWEGMKEKYSLEKKDQDI